MFGFALSSRSYVDSLNYVYSGINMDLSRELSAKESWLCRWLFYSCKSFDQQLHKNSILFLKTNNFHVGINA